VETDICKLAGRSKIGWENDIKEALRIMRVNNWTMCIRMALMEGGS